MGELHRLIESRGKQGALDLWSPRSEVDAAHSYMTDEDTSIGYIFSGFCQAALPHKKLPNASDHWEITSEHIALMVEPGSRRSAEGKREIVGVPYGSRARLIMLYLQSEALRTKSRNIELGRSMREWLGRMNISWGGKSGGIIRDQAERISACHISLHISSGPGYPRRYGMKRQNIVDEAFFLEENEDLRQGPLLLEMATLSHNFFKALQEHAVPLAESALRIINNNSMALDIYCWLAFRLRSLKGPTPISWAALKTQFGAGFKSIRDFRMRFRSNLNLALAVYPDARLDDDDKGLTLFPSPAPVRPRNVVVKLP